MAALVLSLAGAALGGELLGSAGVIGGRIAGALAGSLIDRQLFSSGGGDRQLNRSVTGPRLDALAVQSSTEGAAIPRLYGRSRLSGQIIWATSLEEVVSVSSSTSTASSSNASSGGKGMGGGASTSTTSVTTTTTSYSYFANLAVGLCEGEVAHVGRIWADGKPLSLDGITWRFYHGTEDQEPDALIIAKQGATNAPAYRGLAYIVFERLPLADFGNRIPQLSFELIRPIGKLEQQIRALALIPGASEFGLDPRILVKTSGEGSAAQENRHTFFAQSDFSVAIDEAQALCPNLERVSLIAGWFGSDLRADHCVIQPKVDRADKEIAGASWSVAGLTRASAAVVSSFEGKPAYGGSPSDDSLRRAILDLTGRGLGVMLCPFLMMDIAAGNSLPDPLDASATQPAYPWRGRITGSDNTSAASAQVSAFFGTAQASHFALSGADVVYSGPTEWRYRRFILHMAMVAKAAGGVESFVIGSEMIGLTRLRSSSGVYAAVAALKALAAEVRTILPEAKLVYAADWSEYGAHVIGDEVRFPLDPLFADSHIDAIGIDFYAPLSDWREGTAHADAALAANTYDETYLRSRVFAGEAFDFYYASPIDRLNGLRNPITDGLGKPWIYRQKDLRSWWANSHIERVGGVETSATGWVPGMKPLWLTECGVPAVDKGANQPSTFPDTKSAESALPYFSTGERDDLIQRRAASVLLSAFDPAFGATDSENPPASLYAGRMLDPAHSHVWAYDARPWPAFPLASSVWGDADNWTSGHWLNGRLGTAPLSELIAAILTDSGVSAFDTSGALGLVDGFVLDRAMSARAAIEDLCSLFAVEAREEGETLVFFSRPNRASFTLTRDICVDEEGKPLITTKRVQDSELPLELTVTFAEGESDYRSSTVSSRRLVGASRRSQSLDLGASASRALLQAETDNMLQDLWAGRDTLSCAVPPSLSHLQPGDLITLDDRGIARNLMITSLNGTLMREMEARAIPMTRTRPAQGLDRRMPALPPAVIAPLVALMELPVLNGQDGVTLRIAASTSPWPGTLGLWRGSAATGFSAAGAIAAPSVMGRTLTDLSKGPLWRLDHGASLEVKLLSGALSSLPLERVLGGANAFALDNGAGGFEIIQFTNALLIGERTYRLSGLLRGAGGSEAAMVDLVPSGATLVMLDASLTALMSGADGIGRETTWRVAPSRLGYADSSSVEITAAPTGLVYRPLAPVHLKAQLDGGDIVVSWIRRTRLSGDNWDLAETPLGETDEAYRLHVLDAAGLSVASYDTSEPSFRYSAAALASDFPSPPTAISFSVAQLSALVGEGFATRLAFAL